MTHKGQPRHKEARVYRYLANGMSDGRKYTAPLLGFLVASQIINIQKLQYAVGASEATDFLDGLFGKKSHALEPNEAEKIDGGERDQKADKWLFRSIMSGLVVKALTHQKYRRAALYTGITLVQTVRDYKVQTWRNRAIKESVNPGAINAARVKTGLNDVALLVALDQDRHIPNSDVVADGLLIGATVLSLTTMKHYRHAFTQRSESTTEQIAEVA